MPALAVFKAHLRSVGAYRSWPRWVVVQGDSNSPAVQKHIQQWLRKLPGPTPRACGWVAWKPAHGTPWVALVAGSAQAEMSVLPPVRLSAWVPIAVRFRVPVRWAQVWVLGPSGTARTIPSSLHHRELHASFSADQPGTWRVQIVAESEQGVFPLADAAFVAGDPSVFHPSVVPGEQETGTTPGQQLLAMVNQARLVHHKPRLMPAKRLHRVAQRHAERMALLGKLAHDIGTGNPEQRALRSGLMFRQLGENIAHASNLQHAHRVLWQSASHRQNLLSPFYRDVGVGVATSADGSVWVVELFTQPLSAQPGRRTPFGSSTIVRVAMAKLLHGSPISSHLNNLLFLKETPRFSKRNCVRKGP
jgi:uncharacterized protein YkwD